MKKSKFYNVIKESVIMELRKIFPLKGNGKYNNYSEAKKLGIKFNESIFENFEYRLGTHQAR
jgi:hypothetical protein